MHSGLKGEYFPIKSFLPFHFTIKLSSLDEDITYNKLKTLEIKFKKIINFNSENNNMISS